MTTHQVPTGHSALRAAARRLNEAHAVDVVGQPLDAATVDGDPHDRPLARREPGRALIIQAVRDYADWLEAHPDVPAPTHLSGTAHPGDDYEESVRVAAAFAEQFGARKQNNGGTRWATHTIAYQPLSVQHTVFAATPPAAPDGW